jgi:hypothetical protein
MGCGCKKRAKAALDLAKRDEPSFKVRAARKALDPSGRITRRVRKHFENVANADPTSGGVLQPEERSNG